MSDYTTDDLRLAYALIAASTALHEETEPRKLLVAALAVRQLAPQLARQLVSKARDGMRQQAAPATAHALHA